MIWLRIGAFAISTALCSCTDGGDVDSATAPAARSDEVATSRDASNLAIHVDQFAAAASSIRRAEFDPAALADTLGNDAQAHFAWVREHTWWAPYRGVLRGPTGVLLDRVGSSLDRAYLLADLLRRAGHTVRLAHAEFAHDKAQELLPRVQKIPSQRGVGDRSLTESASGTSAASIDMRIALSEQATSNAEVLIDTQTEALLTALAETPTPKERANEIALSAIRDHWWVEYQDNGTWVALDVLLPDTIPGQTHIAASSVIPWLAGDTAPPIDPSEWHTVGIRVVIERYEGGTTKELTVLAASVRPSDVLGEPLKLRHAPIPWPDRLPDPDIDPQSFRTAALAATMWVPVLQIGRQEFAQSAFTENGKLHDDLPKAVDEFSRLGAAGVTSGMDMALGGFSADTSTPVVSAEWIDYEIIVPGGPVERLRRPVFDLLGPARRAASSGSFDGTAELRRLERFEALWAPTEILIQPSTLTADFVADIVTSGLVDSSDALKELLRETEPSAVRDKATDILDRIEIWDTLPYYALWRTSLGASANTLLICRPNVLQFRGGRVLANAGSNVFRELLDVAANRTDVVNSSAHESFHGRVRQGVTDTVAEMLALGADLGMAENTASIFGRLAAEGSRGMVVGAGDEAAARTLPWPEDEIERVTQDVLAGYTVVVPRKAVMIGDLQRVGWWRVDPTSGETIGVMDSGFHAGTVEYLKSVAGTLAVYFARPGNVERADAARRIIANGGHRMLTHAQRHHLALYDAYRSLMGDLEFLARGPG